LPTGGWRRRRQARLPFQRIMDGFDWTHPRSINRAQAEQLRRLGFLKDKGNVLILNLAGVGKTIIASCLARNACEKGVSRFSSRPSRHRQRPQRGLRREPPPSRRNGAPSSTATP
jgi:hypothetical protein